MEVTHSGRDKESLVLIPAPLLASCEFGTCHWTSLSSDRKIKLSYLIYKVGVKNSHSVNQTGLFGGSNGILYTKIHFVNFKLSDKLLVSVPE